MIPQLNFGSTGHISTRCIFGGTALSKSSQDEADEALEILLKYQINHIDTAAGYGDSELRIGPWMRNYRDHFFLATKTGERSGPKARAELEKSLDRLRVDHVDLIQMHSLTEPDEWEQAMGNGGALEALIKAREEGLTRFIGVTGHGISVARMHLAALQRHPFDSVLLPLNYPMSLLPYYASDFQELFELCQKRGVAVQTIKAIARRRWSNDERPQQTWYEPLTKQEDIDASVHWLLSHEGVFLNTAGELSLLPRILDAADRFNSVDGDFQEPIRTSNKERKMAPLFTISQNQI